MTVPRNFKQRQDFFSRQITPQTSWLKCYNHILAVLTLLSHSRCTRIVELGCGDGSLAVACLTNLHTQQPLEWVGYDISPYFIQNAKRHEQFIPCLLEDQIWNLNIPRFDVFVSSHTLEHLYSDEVEKLVAWLSSHAKYAVVCVPLRPDKTAVGANHILDKGFIWLRELFVRAGFRIIWDTGRYFGWYEKY